MSTTAPLIERVARAICEQTLFERRGYSPEPRTVDRLWPDFAQQAEAAIEIVTGDHAAAKARRRARATWDELLL